MSRSALVTVWLVLTGSFAIYLAVSRREIEPAPVALQTAEKSRPAATGAGASPWLGAESPSMQPGTARPVSLAESIDRLTAGNKPEGAFKAFQLISSCMDADEPLSGDEKKAKQTLCATMTEAIRRSRLEYLDVAFKARMPEAALAMLDVGPFGDPTALRTRPDDPLVQQWKQELEAMLHMHARAGDPQTMIRLAFELQGPEGRIIGEDKTLSLAYLLARREQMLINEPGEDRRFEDQLIQIFGKDLSDVEKAAASTAASAMVADWRRTRKK